MRVCCIQGMLPRNPEIPQRPENLGPRPAPPLCTCSVGSRAGAALHLHPCTAHLGNLGVVPTVWGFSSKSSLEHKGKQSPPLQRCCFLRVVAHQLVIHQAPAWRPRGK